MIMDIEDFSVFTDAMELHYIDMKAFTEAVNAQDTIALDDNPEQMLSNWLSIITQKDINNKSLIQNIKEEEIRMVVTTLARQSEDKIIRQAYQRRKDEIYFHNKEKQDYQIQLDQAHNKIKMAEMELAERDAIIEELRSQLGR